MILYDKKIKIISNFGTNHFYSADVFNENTPKSTDLDYLANVNAAIYQSIIDVDIKGSLLAKFELFSITSYTLINFNQL